MKVTFRIDDVSLYMNWENFNHLVKVFDKNSIKPLLGVIPNNHDPELCRLAYDSNGWDKIIQLKESGWMISQHGYKHLYSTKDPGILGINQYSEFAGIDYSKQYEMISDGKNLLDQRGLASDIFMAPAHSYDRNTLIALKQLGFKYVTDGYSIFPYENNSLKFIPCQSSRPINGLIGIITVCLHPNTMMASDFEELNKWIEGNSHKICDYSYALNYPSYGLLSKAIEKFVLALRYVKKVVR
jgi:predicted deacetylase